MPKRPTKPMPTVPAEADSSESGRHRSRPPGYASRSEVDQLERRVDEHIESDNQQLGLLRDEVDEARSEIREVRGEVKDVSGHVSDLRVDVAEVSTQVKNISSMLGDQLQIKHVKMVADVDLGKATEIAKIEDNNDRRKAFRSIWVKVCLIIIGWIAGMLIERFR